MVERTDGEENNVIDAETAAMVATMRADYPNCFACGPENPIGLHLDPADTDGSEAVARFSPVKHHGGAGVTLHGGLAATVLDEIMVWAGILTHRVLTVTGKMDLRFRKPVLVTDEVSARGRVDERRGKRLLCSAKLEVDGVAAVTATGLYLVSREFDPEAITP